MILVTGVTGLVGAHLLFKLLQDEDNVVAIYKSDKSRQKTKKIFSYYSSDYENIFSKIIWKEADITDIDSLLDVFVGITEVFHCAGYVNFDPSAKDTVMAINHLGTANIVNVCLEKSVEVLHYISSIAAIGTDANGELITEEIEWQISKTNSVYSISKYHAEMEVFRGVAEGLKVTIVNPGLIIGPGEWHSSSLILFHTVWNGMKFYSNGINGYVDVRDVVGCMLQLRKNNIYNQKFIVVSENISYRDLFNYMSAAMGKKPPYIKITPFMTQVKWRLEKIKSFFTGQSPIITKDSIKSVFVETLYSNKKIVEAIDYKFVPIERSISETTVHFLNDIKSQL
ncbi:MAG: NAD-dependent epimerase/dehydratase family protein [Bacteroidales bacterium]|nr:NAD-dependent epimerase/dehydratase family protein [Bacteroidales bacterium]